jgi:pimeloyl-ACP methyl ester carboxylesterase
MPLTTREGLHRATAHGADIRYLRVGSGRPIVLLHTLRTQLDYFGPLLQHLDTRQAEVIAIDLPGHGESSAPRVDYTDSNRRPPPYPPYGGDRLGELLVPLLGVGEEALGVSTSTGASASSCATASSRPAPRRAAGRLADNQSVPGVRTPPGAPRRPRAVRRSETVRGPVRSADCVGRGSRPRERGAGSPSSRCARRLRRYQAKASR